MIGFLSAHGFDPGPTQRPFLAGLATGAIGAIPAAIVFYVSRSFQVLANEIFQTSYALTALAVGAAFIGAGGLYGLTFRRAANDRQGGWLFGLTFGFLLWLAAPIAILPLVGRPLIAAGMPAIGFLTSFLLWGLCVGLFFPYVHKPLQADLDGVSNKLLDKLGPGAAAHRGGRMAGPPA